MAVAEGNLVVADILAVEGIFAEDNLVAVVDSTVVDNLAHFVLYLVIHW